MPLRRRPLPLLGEKPDGERFQVAKGLIVWPIKFKAPFCTGTVVICALKQAFFVIGVVEHVFLLVKYHIVLVLHPYFPYCAWVVLEIVLNVSPSLFNLVVTIEVLFNAGGVQLLPNDRAMFVFSASSSLFHLKFAISSAENSMMAFLPVSLVFWLPPKVQSLRQKASTLSLCCIHWWCVSAGVRRRAP